MLMQLLTRSLQLDITSVAMTECRNVNTPVRLLASLDRLP